MIHFGKLQKKPRYRQIKRLFFRTDLFLCFP